jgi:hypothetical protein
MLYHVTRNGRSYGPYTLEDLSRYVASGNIQLTDMAKSDEMPEWVPVSSLLQPSASVPPPQPPFAPTYQPPYTAPAAVGEPPPNLNWGLLILLTIVTCGIFAMVWTIVQSAWMNRIVPASRQLALGIAVVVSNILVGAIKDHHTWNYHQGWSVYAHQDRPIVSFLQLCVFILIVFARFNMRNAMERYYNTVEPIGLRLSGIMTFFFGGLYFQYHMNRINGIKRAVAYGAPRL